MRKLLSIFVGALLGLTLGACQERPTTPDGSASLSHGAATCQNVEGTGTISGSVFPDDEGNVVASGPVRGDISGTFTLVRDPDAPTQQGNGTVFAFYKEARLETDELGTFTGTAEGNFNIGLGEEGQRSDRAVVRADFDGPGSKHGKLQLRGEFDFSDFPPIITADFKYNARLCPRGS